MKYKDVKETVNIISIDSSWMEGMSESQRYPFNLTFSDLKYVLDVFSFEHFSFYLSL